MRRGNSMDSLLVYLAVAINLLAVVLSVYDKWASKQFTAKRIREAVLVLISVLGGSLGMFLTMIIIRHKTRHIKFMLGIPLIMVVQLLLLRHLGLL